MFSVYNSEETKRSQYDSLPDYHLQNPLYSITNILDSIVNRKIKNDRMKTSYAAIKRESNEMIESNPIILKDLALNWFSDRELDTVAQTLSDCLTRLEMDQRFSDRMDCSLMLRATEGLAKNFPLSAWVVMRGMQRVVIAMNALSSRRPPPPMYKSDRKDIAIMSVNGGRLLITGAFVGYQRSNSSSTFIFGSDWVRSISDVYTERFLVYSGSTVGQTMADDHYPDINTIAQIIAWGDRALEKYGNDGFKLLKAYEALVLGVLQGKSESNFVDTKRFLRNTLNDITDENLSMGRDAVRLVKMLDSIESPHHLIQLFGLHRIWGHPLVDASKGMEKMIIIGQKDIVKGEKLPRVLGSHFKKLMAQGYRNKHGTYPNVKRSSDLSVALSNNDDWGEIINCFGDSDWDLLEFDKTFAIPESFNLSMIVADKSVSPTLSELKENILIRGTVMNQELRRGVLRWINHESIDPREFLQDVNDGKFPHDHKIIGLRSKEREMNPTPRMFALMSHLMRVYVVLTESMLSEHILPYFPQITMTDSQLDLTKKMYSTVKNQSKRAKRTGALFDTKTVCMSLDFEKWNGHMRKEATFFVFKALGELFGMENLYNETYELFKDSYFYLADGSYVPKLSDDGDFVPEPPLSFTGHKGGQEGLRQKGWTIFTVVGLDWICRKHNCTYKIMGMGDNQVLQLTMYTYHVDASGIANERGLEEMRNILFGLFDDLLEVFNDLGLPLKPLETWISEDLFVYGKYPVLNGVPLTMDLKKIMRIFPFSNQETMTVENALNTIAGNAQAATQAAPFLGTSYVIGLFMGFLCSHDMLQYHPLLAKGLMEVFGEDPSWGLKFKDDTQVITPMDIKDLTVGVLRFLMMSVPRVLGGYVSFNLFSLMMRGFPDPVSISYSQLYAWGVPQADEGIEGYLKRWLKPLYMPERSMKLLVEDVSSVNLLAPVTPTAGLRRVVERFLSDVRVIKNSEFRDLMTCRDNDLEEVISEHLCSGDNLHIRLIHDIMESTIYGYIKSITSKVTKSSTIVSLAIGKTRGDPLGRLMMDEENYFKFFAWRTTIDPAYNIPTCPTAMAKDVRVTGWGKQLIGVTVAYPWSFLTRAPCYNHQDYCNCNDGFIAAYFPDSPVTKKEWNRSIGKNPPYLGSMTKEKVIVSTGSRIYSGEPLVRRPINLMRVIGWFVPEESEIAKVIMSCVSAVSDIDPMLFKGVTEGTSGSEIHRFRDTSLKHGALCSSNYLFSTRYHISTDTFSRYAKGAQNYDMLFQANLCSIIESCHQYVLNTNVEGDPQVKSHHFKQTCYECINPLDETFYDINSSKLAKLIPSKKTNKYLYVTEDKISMVKEYQPTIGWVSEVMSADEFALMHDDFKLKWLTDAVADNIVIDIMSPAGEESYVTTSLMDIKEHNRLFYLTVKPKDLYDQLCNRIFTLAEWRCMSLSEWKVPTPESVMRAAEAIISETPITRWYGMTGFFSWPSSMNRYYVYPEIQEPDSIPVSAYSACKSIKNSMTGLILRGGIVTQRKTRLFSEDSKNSKIVLKLMIYDWVKSHTSCRNCLKIIGTMPSHKLAAVEPLSLICQLGHFTMQGYNQSSIRKSRVTLDSLRKGISSDDEEPIDTEKNNTVWPYLTSTTCCPLFDSDFMKSELIPFSHTNIDRKIIVRPIPEAELFKIFSLPTNAMYKYYEIFSYVSEFLGKVSTAFVTGNGLGGTSRVLCNVWKGKIITSTLLDTGDALPQVYPNCDSGHVSHQSDRIITGHMVELVNDVTHNRWSKEWKPIMIRYDCDLLVSDIEISGEDNSKVREMCVNNLVGLHDWQLCIIKDYIYSLEEMELRLSQLLGCFESVELITCNSRQRVMPEVWWILKKKTLGLRKLGYHRSVTLQIWDSICYGLNLKDWNMPHVFGTINSILSSERNWTSMMVRIRSFFSLPIVGSALPYKGTYTRLLGYLQRGKKPMDITIVATEDGKKLYQSDYERLREVLFGLAVSMCASISERDIMLNNSEFWVMDWKPISPNIWLPYLKKIDRRTTLVHVYDYIPTLSLLMKREGLLFKTHKDIIEFKYNRDRKVCCFPITKTAHIKFKDSGFKGKW
ncbi:TPA_asm: L [Artemisia alphacytorhabdovirus 1]|nr:TPA_asm: L [Artemisia alphacytorhabdovirus 1]